MGFDPRGVDERDVPSPGSESPLYDAQAMSTLDKSSDIERLQALLSEIEKPASQLRWARENPAAAWKVQSHTTVERGVVTIDLHDLGQNLARRVLRICEEAGPDLESGAVRFVTGRGNHSATGPVLRQVVGDALVKQCKRHGWGMHAEGGARFILIIDAERAPASATGSLTWPLYAGGFLFLALALWLSPPLGIGLLFVSFLGFLATR
jgi:hypothetical protein